MKHISERSGEFVAKLLIEERVGEFLASLMKHHPDTFSHSYRVGSLCVDVGYAFSLDDDALRTVGLAGLLHDIGKNCMPLDILGKPGALDEEERRTITSHPRLGFIQLKDYNLKVAKVVVAHHEYKEDPYPRTGKDRRSKPFVSRIGRDRRKSEDHIKELSQLVAAVDIYDALSHKRSYKSALPKEEAERIMRSHYRGNHQYIDWLIKRDV